MIYNHSFALSLPLSTVSPNLDQASYFKKKCNSFTLRQREKREVDITSKSPPFPVLIFSQTFYRNCLYLSKVIFLIFYLVFSPVNYAFHLDFSAAIIFTKTLFYPLASLVKLAISSPKGFHTHSTPSPQKTLLVFLLSLTVPS